MERTAGKTDDGCFIEFFVRPTLMIPESASIHNRRKISGYMFADVRGEGVL